jgi:riboflavin biosynthesis pyrimidine reductase
VTLEPLELLDERPDLPQGDLPSELRRLYGGGLGFREPCVYSNFVETLDGVVAIPEVDRSNALVADESDADRFVMGLLRAFADAVLVGAGTLLASPRGTWRPERVFPAAADDFAVLRRGRGDRPAVAVVSTGASLDASHPIFAEGAILLTVESAAADLRASLPAATEVVPVNDGDDVDLRAGLAHLRERGHALILSEAGPTVFGSLLAESLVDELFLTLSPVLAGRLRGSRRLALVEGVELLPDVRRGGELLSVRRGGEHVFLRYRL